MTITVSGLNRMLLCFFLPLVFCSGTTHPNRHEEKPEQILLADPTIYYHDGTYYLYGTGSAPYNEGFVVYRSKDLKNWKGPVGVKDGYALKKGDAFGDRQFWAPQVFRHNNKFYMAYAANEHIGIAVSDHPLGPFSNDSRKPIEEDTKQIDPYVFKDNDGKTYLYYVVVADGGNRIYVAEMNQDLLSVKKETATKCIEVTEIWENTDKDAWSVAEGPTVLRLGDLYYMVYSANHFRSIDYAVGYAVSKTPYGPWKKYEGNPIISRKVTGQNGSGHGDLVKGKKGEWLYVFHTHNAPGKITPRKTAIVRTAFVKDRKTGMTRIEVKAGSFKFLEANR